MGTCLASFPGLPTDQFVIAYGMQKWRGKVWPILMMSVFSGQRGEGSTGVLNIHKVKNVLPLVQNKEHVHKVHSFDAIPLPHLST